MLIFKKISGGHWNRSQPISVRKYGEGQLKRCQLFCFIFSEHYSMSNILPKDSSKVSYTLKITVAKQFDNFAKRALRVTETGTSRIKYFSHMRKRIQRSCSFIVEFIKLFRKYHMVPTQVCFSLSAISQCTLLEKRREIVLSLQK